VLELAWLLRKWRGERFKVFVVYSSRILRYQSPNGSGNSSDNSPEIQEGSSAPQSPLGGGGGGGQGGSHLYNASMTTRSLPRGTSANQYLIGPGTLYGQERRERPNELSFTNGGNRKQGFVFNNNWNMNKF
jgi:hypothetical protein